MAKPTSPQRPRWRKTRALSGFVVGVGAVVVAFVLSRRSNPGWEVADRGRTATTPAGDGPQLSDGYSNIHPGDYLGPQSCVPCHAKQYALWRSHPHSRMNQDASEVSVTGDFSNRHIHYGDVDAGFQREGDAFFMSLDSGNEAHRRRYRVTRTVGTRFTQMYIGIQTRGPEPRGDPIYGLERKLPFGFWLTRDRWLPVNYFDSDYLPDYAGADSVAPDAERLFRPNHWERNCIYCHNTYPFALRLRSGLKNMSGFPWEDLKLSDDGPSQRRLDAGKLVTLGISCESCHFGGREHATMKKAIRFVPSAPDLVFSAADEDLVKGARDSGYVINSICAQCHAAEGVSLYPNGAGTWNSREALDMLGGACASAIKCTDCHEPHTQGPPGGGPTQPAHVAACVKCHSQFGSDETRTAHSRHGPEVSCLDCHMPRIVQGLDAVVRTHRISSPSDPNMLRQAAPNSCNLCHLDRSIAWTVAALNRHWTRIDADSDWASAYGSLQTPLGRVWREHDIPISRLIAIDAYARTAERSVALPKLLAALDDSSPVNRMFALFALEKLIGRRLEAREYLPTAPPAPRHLQVTALARTLH